MSAAGATGPAPTEGENYRAVTAPTDRQKTDRELENETGAATLASRKARIFGPPKNNGATPVSPFSLGETIDTGITAAVTAKQAQAAASTVRRRRSSRALRALSLDRPGMRAGRGAVVEAAAAAPVR